MIEAPTEGRTLLPAAAARERLWHALAYALNTDQESVSPLGYGLFPGELAGLHASICGSFWPRAGRRARGYKEMRAFAERWRLRARDVRDTCHLIEIHDQPGEPRAGSMVLSMPLVVYERPPGAIPVQVSPADPLIYDPVERTGPEIRAAARAVYESALRAIRAAERAWIRSGALVEVPAQHADAEAVTALARRWIRVVKGWSQAEIARKDGVSVSAVQSSLRTWRDLDEDRARDDASFSEDE